jgi:hypothetical protein
VPWVRFMSALSSAMLKLLMQPAINWVVVRCDDCESVSSTYNCGIFVKKHFGFLFWFVLISSLEFIWFRYKFMKSSLEVGV